MKTLIFLATLALFVSPAMAGEKGGCQSCTKSVSVTVSTSNGGDKLDTMLGCNPAISNWVNASPVTCPMRGSGPQATSRSVTSNFDVEVPCPKPTRSRGKNS